MEYFTNLVVISCALLGSVSAEQTTFTNPILNKMSEHPSILKVADYYYLTVVESLLTEIAIYKSPILTSFQNAERKVAFTAQPGYLVGGSDLYEIDGELYIYVTMRNSDADHHMYVIKSDQLSNPMGSWSNATRLILQWEYWSADGTVLKHNGKLYFVWTGVHSNNLRALYIAEMKNPTTVVGHVVLIRLAEEPWEHGIIDCPYFIYNKGKSYLVHSVDNTRNPDCSLTWMSLEDGKDPLDPTNWVKAPGPVFTRNDEESVYTIAHASFTVSPDGSETWMVYRGTVSFTQNDFLTARIEKITWNEDGTPNFPKAHGYNHPQALPSGQLYVGIQ